MFFYHNICHNYLISEFCYGKSYHQRAIFIEICLLVMDLYSKTFFKSHYFEPLLELGSDPVPNIRLRLCPLLPKLKVIRVCFCLDI